MNRKIDNNKPPKIKQNENIKIITFINFYTTLI